MYTGHQLKFLIHDIKNPDKKLFWLAEGAFRKTARSIGLDTSLGWEISTRTLLPRICQDSYDVVLASGPPFSTFRLAERVSDRMNIPLVLDYRDGWTQGCPFIKKHLLGNAYHLIEKRIVSKAALLITVSPGLKSSLIKSFNVASKIHVVTNGYNPSELELITPMDFGHPAIVYAGNLYPPKSNLTPIFAALKIIVDNKYDVPDNWRLHYFGEHSQLVSAEAARFDLMDRVIVHGNVPREQALRANKGSVASIVITTISTNLIEDEKGIVTGKIFDLIGLGCRILLITPHGSDAEVITRLAGLGECYDGGEVNNIGEYICRCINGIKPAFLASDDYSWPKLSSRLDALLSKLQ